MDTQFFIDAIMRYSLPSENLEAGDPVTVIGVSQQEVKVVEPANINEFRRVLLVTDQSLLETTRINLSYVEIPEGIVIPEPK